MYPAIAIVVCVVFICIFFQRNIRAFLDRSKGFQGWGIKIDANGKQQNPAKTKDTSVEELMKAFDSPILTEREQLIEKELKSRSVQSDTDKIQILTHHLAATQMNYVFATIAVQIYGSQVALLQSLNTRDNLPKEELKAFYDIATSKYPAFYQRYPFEQYLAFLISWGLIIEKDKNLSITQLGVEFLSFLTRIKRNDAKLWIG